jgi:hypothetical protein
LDAFITTKTINFINSIKDNNKSFVIFKRINEPSTRTIKYIGGKEIMTLDIIDKVKNGSKVFIFYPYKTQAGNNHSMETLFNMIIAQTGQKGVFYHADIGETTKKGLKNVNDAWSEYKFIITNSVITCGINYENEDFDYAYIFTASFNTPRDIIQVSYRCRYLSTGIINLCFLGKMIQPNTWKVDIKEVNDTAYTSLINNILIEKMSPLKQTLQLFSVKAHYKQIIEEHTLTNELANFYKKLLEENIDLGYSYDTIEDIDDYDANQIQQKMFAQTATMYEKICLKKYFYKLQFVKEASTQQIKILDDDEEQNEDEYEETNMLSYIWDNNYSFFFSSYAR